MMAELISASSESFTKQTKLPEVIFPIIWILALRFLSKVLWSVLEVKQRSLAHQNAFFEVYG